MKTTRKKYIALGVALIAVILGVIAWSVLFRVKHVTFREFAELVEGSHGRAASLWKGLYYGGERDGLVYFANRLAWMEERVCFPREHAKGFPQMEFSRFTGGWIDVSDSRLTTEHITYMP